MIRAVTVQHRGRVRAILRRAGGAAIVVLVSCLLLEGIVRLAVRAAPSLVASVAQPGSSGFLRGIVREDPEAGYGLLPGYLGAGDTKIQVAVNSLGFRDREYDLHGADAGRRFVLAAGDSFSFGAGVELTDTFLSQLEARLQQSDPRWSVVKAGVPGYSLVQSTTTVRRHLDRFRPELVIVQMIPQTEDRNLFPQRVVGGLLVIPRPGWRYESVGNDVFDSPFRPGWLAATDRWLRQRSLAFRMSRHAVVSRLSRELDAPTQLRSRAMGLDAVLALHRELRARGTTLLIVLNNWTEGSAEAWDDVADLNRIYSAFCRDHGIAVLDTLPAFRAETARAGYLGRSPTDQHWDAAGHRLAADIIARFLQDLGR
jgi:hypothetical protein